MASRKHEEPICENCCFFEHELDGRDEGECHYYPPMTPGIVAWPMVRGGDWCSKFGKKFIPRVPSITCTVLTEDQ